MNKKFNSTELLTLTYPEWAVVLLIVSAKLIIYIVSGNQYDYFVDEFYFLDCAKHLDWGYVDQPPLSILLLKLVTLTLGNSLYALRFLPTLAGMATIILGGLIAKSLGGKFYGVTLSCLAIFLSPFHLLQQSLFTMNAFDLLLWMIAFYLLLLILNTNNATIWYYLGVVLGFGVQNKLSVLWLCCGIGFAMFVPPMRMWIKRKEPYLCGLIAFVIFSPHIFWQLQNDWPTLEFITKTTEMNYSKVTRIDLFKWIPRIIHPVNTVIVILSIYAILTYNSMKKYRPLLVILVVVLLILLSRGKTKAYYLAPVLSGFICVGAVYIEKQMERFGGWLWVIILSTMLLSIFFTVRTSTPILPPYKLAKITQKKWGFDPVQKQRVVGNLPQYFANEFGWREAVEIIGKTYQKLSPAEKKDCIIFTTHYGYAGAVNLLGSVYQLPTAVCTHNNYSLWGPGPSNGNVMIQIGIEPEVMKRVYSDVQIVGYSRNPYTFPTFNNAPVVLCRGAQVSIQSFWKSIRLYE